MPNGEETYTYRAGRRIPLRKKPDQFVVRASAEEAERLGFEDAEQVSSGSSRVTVRSGDLERSMTHARLAAPTHHAYEDAETGEEFLITDRLFVTFKNPLSLDRVDEFAARYGLLQREAYSDREYLFQLTEHTGMNPVKLVVKLTEEEPLVQSAEHDLNYRASTAQLPLPTDPSYALQWHLHTRLVDTAFDRRSSARCEEAWNILGHHGSPDVVVGVTDDGCKLDHDDFDSPAKFAGWGYFAGLRLVRNTDIDADPARMYQQGANHGTSCAGVIAAELDAALTVGAAPGCRLLPVKWESSGPSLFTSDSKLRTVLDFVADKVDVLSSSWGIVPSSLWSPIVTNRIAQLAQSGGRRGKGIVFLWAAGNENCPIQHQTSIDVPYTNGWDPMGGSLVWVGVKTARRFENNLVGIPGVMHVAALASTAVRSHYSNYGTGIAICAPTSNSHEYRRVTVQGLRITTVTGPGDGVTGGFGGTSSATPLTAGIAGLVISANPQLSALEVISVLKRTASKDLRFDAYPRTPPATFNADVSWDVSPVAPFDGGAFGDVGAPEGTWSPWFGHGRVDAPAAVAEALRLQGGTTRPIRMEASPNGAIPDNDPAGLESVLHLQAAGKVRHVRVEVELSHSWIGDLRAQLSCPDGTSVVLHDRSGASQRDLRRTYDSTTLPALASFNDRETAGDWVLRVQDLARADTGTLHRWALEIDAAPQGQVWEDAAAVVIPDDDPNGVDRVLELPAGLVIGDLAVSVDITHSFIGDLLVALTPPGADTVVLHNRAGSGADNLQRTWRMAEVPGLQPLRERDGGGPWRLQAADLAARDLGKLNRWSIEIVPA
jgi:subtilisin-like proprotein convertase family protein/subtilisin family serine protease